MMLGTDQLPSLPQHVCIIEVFCLCVCIGSVMSLSFRYRSNKTYVKCSILEVQWSLLIKTT